MLLQLKLYMYYYFALTTEINMLHVEKFLKLIQCCWFNKKSFGDLFDTQP